MTQRKNEYLM